MYYLTDDTTTTEQTVQISVASVIEQVRDIIEQATQAQAEQIAMGNAEIQNDESLMEDAEVARIKGRLLGDVSQVLGMSFRMLNRDTVQDFYDNPLSGTVEQVALVKLPETPVVYDAHEDAQNDVPEAEAPGTSQTVNESVVGEDAASEEDSSESDNSLLTSGEHVTQTS